MSHPRCSPSLGRVKRKPGQTSARLEQPESVQDRLRVEAAKNEMSMASYARKLVEDGLAGAKRERKGNESTHPIGRRRNPG
jgi:hypothetical protein